MIPIGNINPLLPIMKCFSFSCVTPKKYEIHEYGGKKATLSKESNVDALLAPALRQGPVQLVERAVPYELVASHHKS